MNMNGRLHIEPLCAARGHAGCAGAARAAARGAARRNAAIFGAQKDSHTFSECLSLRACLHAFFLVPCLCSCNETHLFFSFFANAVILTSISEVSPSRVPYPLLLFAPSLRSYRSKSKTVKPRDTSTKMSGSRYAHTGSGVNSQGNSYTSYAGGGYAYNNAPSSGQPHGSTYFTPTAATAASGAGFYASKGGAASSGPSFYQNSSGGRSYSSKK